MRAAALGAQQPAAACKVLKSAAGGRAHQPTPVREVRDTTFAGPAGDVPVRVYVPTPEGAPPQAGVVYFHGGAGPDGTLKSFAVGLLRR